MSVAGVNKNDLDRDGCAYGQVTRERLTNLQEDVARIERKLDLVLTAIVLQLLSAVAAIAVYVVERGLH